MENDEDQKKKGYYFIFYWDPDDKRIFVPKRYGYGWTVNFANPVSIIALFVLIILSLLLVKVF